MIVQERERWLWGAVVLVFLLCCVGEARGKGKRPRRVWESLSEGIMSLDVSAVTVDPNNPKQIYAGARGVLYRSTDGGSRWYPIARFRGASRRVIRGTDTQLQVRRLKQKIYEEKYEDLVAEVGEDRAREMSTELEREAEEEAERRIRRLQGSRSRREASRFSREIRRIAVARSNSKVLVVATDGGAYRSTDGGRTFRLIHQGRAPGEGDVVCLAVDPTNAKRLYLGTRRGLYFSKDGGQFWTRAQGKLRTLSVKEIRLHPRQPKKLYIATERGLFLSSDGGKNFGRSIKVPASTAKITSLALLPLPTPVIVVGTSGGIYLSSNNGRSFRRPRAGGLGIRLIKYLTSSLGDPHRIYLISERGVFLSENKGRDFVELRAGMLTQNIRYLAIDPQEPDRIWAATDYGLLRWSRVAVGKVTLQQWKRFQRELRREPSPWRVAQAAVRYFMMERRRGMALRSRLLWRAFLPQVRFQARLYLDRDEDSILLRRPFVLRLNEGRAFLIQVNAVWKIPELIFQRSLSRLAGDNRRYHKARERKMTKAIRLYHARRRLQIRLFASPPKTIDRYMRSLLKFQELTAYLDALTGGFFSKNLPSRRR